MQALFIFYDAQWKQDDSQNVQDFRDISPYSHSQEFSGKIDKQKMVVRNKLKFKLSD